MKILDYFFYTFYNSISNFKGNDIPEQTASALFGSLIYMNFISISKNSEMDLFSYNKLINIIIGVGFMIPIYFLFVKNDRYKRIIEIYKLETKINKIIRNLIVWGYFIFSMIWVLKSFWIYDNIN